MGYVRIMWVGANLLALIPLAPLLIRFPGEHWRLANGWKTLNFYKRKGTTDGLKSHAG